MSLGDNNSVKIERMQVNSDLHSSYASTAIYTNLECSILRMSPDRESQVGLGGRVLGYDMHVGQAIVVKLGDRVTDKDNLVYDVYGVDVIQDIDTFTRVTLKREYVEEAVVIVPPPAP